MREKVYTKETQSPARAEGINARIQWIKYTGRGFRNRERFRRAIYFHLGGLNMNPERSSPLFFTQVDEEPRRLRPSLAR